MSEKFDPISDQTMFFVIVVVFFGTPFSNYSPLKTLVQIEGKVRLIDTHVSQAAQAVVP